MNIVPPSPEELETCMKLMIAKLADLQGVDDFNADSAYLSTVKGAIDALEESLNELRTAGILDSPRFLAILSDEKTANCIIGSFDDSADIIRIDSFSEAMHILRTQKIDLILSEIRLQPKDKREDCSSVFDLLRWVKGDPFLNKIPFVCLSPEPISDSASYDGLRIAARSLGAAKFLAMENFDQDLFRSQLEMLLPDMPKVKDFASKTIRRSLGVISDDHQVRSLSLKANAHTILIVDDMAINLMASGIVVRSLGYCTDEAKSGQDALDKLKGRSYVAILMDLQMPDMNGFQCAENIRIREIGTHRRVPIIGFSSMAEGDVKRKCIDAGMDAFLDKGCSSKQLAKVLSQFVPELPNLPGLVA